MVSRLFRICRIQWWCSFCLFFDQNYSFWASLVQKVKVVSLSWNLVLRLINFEYAEFNGGVYFLSFRPKIPFFVKFCPKIQNCLYIVTFGTQSNLDMQNSMAMLTFPLPYRKHPFWGNWIKKIKIFSLRWNLVPRLIRISRIQWWCTLFLFLTRDNCSGQNLKLFVQSKIWYLELFEYEEFNGDVDFFSVFVWKYPCLGKLFQKIKIVCWSWNLIPRLIWVIKIW